jgi:hypothetical protein
MEEAKAAAAEKPAQPGRRAHEEEEGREGGSREAAHAAA